MTRMSRSWMSVRAWVRPVPVGWSFPAWRRVTLPSAPARSVRTRLWVPVVRLPGGGFGPGYVRGGGGWRGGPGDGVRPGVQALLGQVLAQGDDQLGGVLADRGGVVLGRRDRGSDAVLTALFRDGVRYLAHARASVRTTTARAAAARTRATGSSASSASSPSASPTRRRAATFAAISLTRHDSSPSPPHTQGRAESSQAYSKARIAQTRSQYCCPPSRIDRAAGPPIANTSSSSASRPASRSMHLATTSASPRRAQANSMLSRGVRPHTDRDGILQCDTAGKSLNQAAKYNLGAPATVSRCTGSANGGTSV